MSDYDDRPLPLVPGLFTEASEYASTNRYVAATNVRWWKNFAERIGGWLALLADTINAPARGALAWRSLAGVQYVAFGHAEGLELLSGGALFDISPSGTDGFITLVISVSGQVGVYTVNETVTATGGGTAKVVSVAAGTVNTSAHTGTFTGTLTGGSSGATATITSTAAGGRVNGSAVVGWGEGAWGSGTWGGAASIYATTLHATTWTLVNWGEDLIANPRGGKIYTWDTSVGTGTRATRITNSPTDALGVFVSDTNRTLVAYGAHNGTASDPLNLRWTDEEDFTVWTAASDNTAGSIRCEVGNEIVGAISTRGGHMLSTDRAIYFFSYAGAPFIFANVKVTEGPSMISPHSGIDHGGIAYFMGPQAFFVYDGAVRELPCDVKSAVFGRLNLVQRFKVYCGTIRKFNEVVWFVVSTESQEIDFCVGYNPGDATQAPSWWMGDVARTSWIDASVVLDYPIATDANGAIYAQEYGITANGSDLNYTLETGDMQIGDGSFLHARKLLPNYDRISGEHSVSIECRGYPARSATTKGPYVITDATDNLSVRARGRNVRLLWEGSGDFRMGQWQSRVTAHGKRP